MFGSIGPLELMLIFIIVLIVFGADRLPELARGLGKGLREFRKAANEIRDELMLDELDVDLNKPLEAPESKTAYDAYPPPTDEDWDEDLYTEEDEAQAVGGKTATDGEGKKPDAPEQANGKGQTTSRKDSGDSPEQTRSLKKKKRKSAGGT